MSRIRSAARRVSATLARLFCAVTASFVVSTAGAQTRDAVLPGASQQSPTTGKVWVSPPRIIQSPNGERTQLRGINIHGQVIGFYGAPRAYHSVERYLTSYFSWRAEPIGSRSFLWSRAGGFQDLGELTVAAINDCGDIAGTLTAREPFRAFRKVGAHLQELGTLEPDNPTAWSIATGINEHGDVVGVASVSQPNGNLLYSGFKWTEADGMVEVHDRQFFSEAHAINNRRQIAGSRQGDVMSSFSGSIRWEADGTELRVAGLGGRYSSAAAINTRGELVGTSATGHQLGPLHAAFVWSADTGTVELWPGGAVDFYMDIGSTAHDIDDRGRIAGVVNLAAATDDNPVRRAAIWISPTEYHALSDSSSDAVSLNSRGDVIGHLFDMDNFTQQGVIWRVHTPVDKSIVDAAYATLQSMGICYRRKHGD